MLGIFNFIPLIRMGSDFDPTSIRLGPYLASKLPKILGGRDVRTERTATMLDTALLIASALSLALMVAFSELP